MTPERVGLHYQVAGIGSRAAAALLDGLIQALILAVLLAAVLTAYFSLFRAPSRAATETAAAGDALPPIMWVAIALVAMASFLVFWGYHVLFEMVWNGQTPGKRWLGLRVIRENGYPIRPGDAVVRNLVRIVDALPSGYAIGLVVMLLNDRAKRLGDFAAGTIVVREDRRSTLASLDAIDPAGPAGSGRSGDARDEGQGEPDEPDEGYALPALTAEHATLVRDFLVRRQAMVPAARRQLAARLARTMANRYGIVSPGQDEDAEAFLERLAER